MSSPSLQQPSFLLVSPCSHHLLSLQELHPIFPWLVESVFGSLDGIISGWNLRLLHSRSHEYAIVLDFLNPSGPMMKLVYKIQAEEYKYELPVNYLPGPVKACIQEGVLPDCPLFHNKLQFPPPGVMTPNIALNPFEFFMFHLAYCLVAPRNCLQPQLSSSTDSAYFVLVDMYLKYFLPVEGSVPPSPFSDARGSVTAPSPRASSVSFAGYGVHSPSLLKHHIFHQPSVNADPAAQEIWRSETLLQMFVEIWLHHYSLDMYQKLQSPQVKEPFSPSEEHVLVVRLLVKHLHAFSNSLKPEQPSSSPSAHSHPSPLEEFKRVVVQRFVQQKLYLFLQHCFGHWPLDASFRAVRFPPDQTDLKGPQNKSFSFVLLQFALQGHRNTHIQVIRSSEMFQNSRLFVCILSLHLSLLSSAEISENLSDPGLCPGEQLFLEPDHVLHHRQPRGYLTPSQGGSYLSTRQRVVMDTVFKVKSHVYSLEGQDCQYKQMFGSEVRGAVMKFIQIIAQARHTAKRISDHSNEASCSLSLTDDKILVNTDVLTVALSGAHMSALCSRSDFLGRLGRRFLTEPEPSVRLKRSPMSRRTLERSLQPRLSLRPLASYRTLLLLLLFYALGALLSFGPLSSTALLLTGALLYGVAMTLFVEKLKTQ
uniref:Sphingomyelin phosphodiesterase 4 n=1 Tax=Cyprinodon variegatus TaxID=28743 RepID=A0A3Q2C692_CYPVA